MASTYLTRTPSSTGNRKTFTFSAWIKRCSTGGTHYMAVQGSDGNNNWAFLFDGSDRFQMWNYVSDFQFNLKTNRKFRDLNAWYHLMGVVDTTQATSSDRVKLYVNGVQETSFAESTYPSQNADMIVNTTNTFRLGIYTSGTSYFNGIMSHVHFVDGTAYTPSTFGQTDATTGEWSINTTPTVTYGTNGFFMFKNDNSVTDQSGNSNNFTVAQGAVTKTEDCPSNIFATANPLNKTSNIFLGNANCAIGTDNTGTDEYISGTIAFGNGKYYWENKITSPGDPAIGIVPAEYNSSQIGNQRVMYHENGNIYTDGLGISAINTGVTYASGDIISVAFDTENGIIKWYKNNTLVNNSTITNSQLEFSNKVWVPIFYCANGNGNGTIQANFGNGHFGTTAVSSAGTNASNNGIFEYDVPTGYTALSTKGLNL